MQREHRVRLSEPISRPTRQGRDGGFSISNQSLQDNSPESGSNNQGRSSGRAPRSEEKLHLLYPSYHAFDSGPIHSSQTDLGHNPAPDSPSPSPSPPSGRGNDRSPASSAMSRARSVPVCGLSVSRPAAGSEAESWPGSDFFFAAGSSFYSSVESGSGAASNPAICSQFNSKSYSSIRSGLYSSSQSASNPTSLSSTGSELYPTEGLSQSPAGRQGVGRPGGRSHWCATKPVMAVLRTNAVEGC